ncbi:hypothetical protein CNMCM6106_004221 [Aspergillus hiratsukae]|uniref:Uncharacterized protein n=1 Tax=Aspergillus hiratsukae TaxID=1194566 RepID=A0A8H6QBD7_9EURO|nr:hypothetical protein CNMCM6106_004221 [Aspergillus hiratsukae]
MFVKSVVGLALATSAIAAPFTLNSTKWTPDHVLQPDEVILYGEGRMEVVHESVWREIIASQGISLEAPEVPEIIANFPADITANITAGHNETSLHSRDCGATTAMVTDTTQTFIDWDVQMSPVVIGTGNGLTVFVSAGYSASNSISVSAGVDWTVAKDILGLSTGIDYTRTWATQTAYQMSGVVPNGWSGTWITKPTKTRRYGRVLRGCLGSQTQVGTFMADSYESGSYNGVSWIQGAITMCMKQEYPLTRCTGQGTFT